MSQTSATRGSVPPVPLASILPANDESLTRLLGVPALALEWLPGLLFTAYYVKDTFACYPDDAVCRSIAQRYNLESQLTHAGADYAVHGIVVGPDILGNPLGLDSVTLFGLDVYEATALHWADWPITLVALKHLSIEPVPGIRKWWSFDTTLDKLKLLATRQYNTGQLSRGLLLRPLRHEQHDPFYVSVDNPERKDM
jgi:hypothetical protein